MSQEVGKATTEKVIKKAAKTGFMKHSSIVKEDYSDLFLSKEYMRIKDNIIDLSRRSGLR